MLNSTINYSIKKKTYGIVMTRRLTKKLIIRKLTVGEEPKIFFHTYESSFGLKCDKTILET